MIIACLAFANFTFSQDNLNEIENKEKQTTEFKTIKTNVLKPINKFFVLNDFAFKFDPLRMFVNEINFGIEKKIGQHSSLEIDLGPTISNISGIESNYSSNNISQFGYFGNFSFRYYPLYDALNYLYISPSFSYKNLNVIDVDPLKNLSNMHGYTNTTSFLFNIGIQSWLSKTFLMDLYTGVGIGVSQGKNYKLSGYYYYPSNTNSWTEVIENRAKFIFNIGLKVGFGNVKKTDK